MPLSPEAEQVLRAIFSVGPDRSLALGQRLRIPTPGWPELMDFCELLAKTSREEDLQLFLERHCGFLASLVGTPDNNDLAVIFKPQVGFQYKADFCILQAHQGGAQAHLIEIETSHDRLFNKDGTPTRHLAVAQNQIENWRMWIEANQIGYAKELVRQAKLLPMLNDDVPKTRGLRLAEPGRIKRSWEDFGGFERPFFSYTIVIGRWSQMTDQEKIRLISRNRNSEQNLKIFTYEQLARLANFRLERDEWSDENLTWKGALGI